MISIFHFLQIYCSAGRPKFFWKLVNIQPLKVTDESIGIHCRHSKYFYWAYINPVAKFRERRVPNTTPVNLSKKREQAIGKAERLLRRTPWQLASHNCRLLQYSRNWQRS